MAFYEVLFPTNISYGSSGGFGWNTRIVSNGGGFESRQQSWARQRGRWVVSHQIKTAADYRALIAFFHAMNGRLNGFRFFDHTDYRDAGSGTVVDFGGGALGLAKLYHAPLTVAGGAGGATYTRRISKPTADVSVTGHPGAFIDLTTGLVLPGHGITAGAAWTGTFHVPVRFDTDSLDMAIDQPYGSVDSHGGVSDVSPSWANIPLVEIKEPEV
jgi:uncharacterized protein (TIGR02217 family)